MKRTNLTIIIVTIILSIISYFVYMNINKIDSINTDEEGIVKTLEINNKKENIYNEIYFKDINFEELLKMNQVVNFLDNELEPVDLAVILEGERSTVVKFDYDKKVILENIRKNLLQFGDQEEVIDFKITSVSFKSEYDNTETFELAYYIKDNPDNEFNNLKEMGDYSSSRKKELEEDIANKNWRRYIQEQDTYLYTNLPNTKEALEIKEKNIEQQLNRELCELNATDNYLNSIIEKNKNVWESKIQENPDIMELYNQKIIYSMNTSNQNVTNINCEDYYNKFIQVTFKEELDVNTIQKLDEILLFLYDEENLDSKATISFIYKTKTGFELSDSDIAETFSIELGKNISELKDNYKHQFVIQSNGETEFIKNFNIEDKYFNSDREYIQSIVILRHKDVDKFICIKDLISENNNLDKCNVYNLSKEDINFIKDSIETVSIEGNQTDNQLGG